MKPRCIIIGGGGHARVLIDCLQLSDRVILTGLLDLDPSQWGKDIYGVPVLGNDDLLPRLHLEGVSHFVVGLGGAGNNRPRQRLFELALSYGFKPILVTHPTSICSGLAEVDEGAQLLPGSIVNAGARIGPNVIVNSGAIIEHDCLLEGHVHIATGAKLASTVYVGQGAHIGAGATVRQCIRIGEYAVVGMGAVVIRDIPAGITVAGVPARQLKKGGLEQI